MRGHGVDALGSRLDLFLRYIILPEGEFHTYYWFKFKTWLPTQPPFIHYILVHETQPFLNAMK